MWSQQILVWLSLIGRNKKVLMAIILGQSCGRVSLRLFPYLSVMYVMVAYPYIGVCDVHAFLVELSLRSVACTRERHHGSIGLSENNVDSATIDKLII